MDGGYYHPEYDAPERVAHDEAIADLLELLGRPHTIAIARRFACDSGPWRYSELEATLDISPTTLSKRLSALAEAGIVERRSYDEIPPRVEYSTTERGEALRPMFEYLGEWVTQDAAVDTEG